MAGNLIVYIPDTTEQCDNCESRYVDCSTCPLALTMPYSELVGKKEKKD